MLVADSSQKFDLQWIARIAVHYCLRPDSLLQLSVCALTVAGSTPLQDHGWPEFALLQNVLAAPIQTPDRTSHHQFSKTVNNRSNPLRPQLTISMPSYQRYQTP